MDSCVIDAKCSITQPNSFHRLKNHMFCMLAWQICHDKTWPNIYQHLHSKMLMTNCIIIGWSKSMVLRHKILLYAICIMKCVEFILYLSYHITYYDSNPMIFYLLQFQTKINNCETFLCWMVVNWYDRSLNMIGCKS